MNRSHWYLLVLGLILAGGLLIYLAMDQTVTVFVEDQPVNIQTRAFTVEGVLKAGNLALAPDDEVQPGLKTWFLNAPGIRIKRAHPVLILDGDNSISVSTRQRQAGNVLAQAQVKLFPGDQILWNGKVIHAEYEIPTAQIGSLQVRRAVPLTLDQDGTEQIIYSSAPTLGEALWQVGIHLDPNDELIPPAETLLNAPIQASLRRAQAVAVTAGGQTTTIHSAAGTVGEALADAGLALQGLDYTRPGEDQPVPANGKIRLVRVQESVTTSQTLLPYETEYVPDEDTELDHESVIDPGAPGIVLQRERVRSEDGQEVVRISEGEWVAQEPKTRQVGYGTKVVVRTMEAGGTTLEYWRAVTMYATSYSPCRSGGDRCHYGTASGMKAQKGVAAVTVPWFLDMRGQTVYVPGYGNAVIGDTGGGIPGRYWIDLGYNDEDYVSWHQWVTVYFLTPVPPFIPYILYP